MSMDRSSWKGVLVSVPTVRRIAEVPLVPERRRCALLCLPPVPAAKAHLIDWFEFDDKKNWQPALGRHGAERTDAWLISAT